MAHYDPDCATATQLELRDARLANVVPGVANWDKMRLRSPIEFRIIPFGSAQQKQAADHAWEVLGARTFAFVCDDSYLGLSTVNHFKDALRARTGGADPGAEMVIRRGDTDFNDVVSQIRARSPDYVLFAGRPEEAALLLRQLRAAGVKSRFQTGTHHPAQALIDLAKDDAEGVIAAFHGVPAEDFPEGRAFLAAYAARGYPEPPSSYGIYAYAAAQALLGALERSFLTRPSVAGALANERLETVLGPMKFNYFGSNYQNVAIYQVSQGRWKPIYATDKSNKLQPYAAR
jgi:branched-chain amino acid transport system substrate-binding protein